MLNHQFLLPEAGVYMAGHSLGPQPVQTHAVIQQALQDWHHFGVESWMKSNWFDLPQTLGSKIAPLIGAHSDEVLVCDSTVVNLFKVISSAMKLQKKRKVILTSEDNFPADLYIAQGIAAFHKDVVLKIVPAEELVDHLDERVAVLMLTHANYRDASLFDMQKMCDEARRAGVLTIWDLSHSVGIVPLDLQTCGADFAVGCTYKYLSGGPGSPAFVYVNARHHDEAQSPVFGWFGHDKPFDFVRQYESSGCAGFLGGTPPILSFQALDAALNIFENKTVISNCYETVHIHAAFLMEGLENAGLQVITSQSKAKGGHVAFVHPEGYALSKALNDAGVICDYRHPSLLRLCVNPLYLSLDDLAFCIQTIREILQKL